MDDPSVERWQQIEALFHRALELDPQQRVAYLADACEGDAALRDEVESLLSCIDQEPAAEHAEPDASEAALAPGAELGDWRVLELIGRGGMGEVFRCERIGEGRPRIAAVKVLHRGSADAAARFETERDIVASLEHPGIARLLDGGMAQGRPYMLMEHVDGVDLMRHVLTLAPRLDQLLQLFVEICDVVAHAHQKNVVHRDLKPANILIDAQGRPKLLDFGIARVIDVEEQATATQAPMTIAYAAPEQLRGETPLPATDVHALGCLLYELLSGVLPWGEVAESPTSMLIETILHDDPPPCSQAARGGCRAQIPPSLLVGELDRIVGRALSKLAAARQLDAAALAEDLRAFMRGEPTAAEMPRPSADDAQAERRHVTVLFCDMVGSTAIADEMDPEAFRQLVLAYHAVVDEQVDRYGGHVAQYLGDGALVYFGYPLAAEDDTERALRCALDIVERLGDEVGGRLVSARIGIHSGPVVVGQVGQRGQSLAIGSTTNLAARLQALAEPNGVVISAGSFRAVEGLFVGRDLGPQRLKGYDEPVSVVAVDRSSGKATRLEAAAALSPYVGREQELALLRERWTRSLEGDGQAVILRAEPGIGKSRLMLEFQSTAPGASRSELRFTALTRHQAYGPLVGWLRDVAGLHAEQESAQQIDRLGACLERCGQDQPERLALLLPLLNLPRPDTLPPPDYGPEQRREQTTELLAELLATTPASDARLIVIEDLHWADVASLDVITALIERVPRHPLLLLLSARTEFRSQWFDAAHMQVLNLQPLRNSEAGELLEELIGDSALPASQARRIVERAGGVPLFLEEIVHHLAQTPSTQDTGSLADEPVPASLHDLLASRIDRLGEAKSLLQLCAVLGREVPGALLAEIAGLPAQELTRQVGVLVRHQLLLQRGEGRARQYWIRHALIQDVAYDSLLRARQRELHGRIAQAIEHDYSDLYADSPALLAQHFEQAGEATKAIAYYREAVDRAAAQSAIEQSRVYSERALVLVEALPTGQARDELELELRSAAVSGASWSAGYADPAVEPHLDRALELLERIDNPAVFSQTLMLQYMAAFNRTEMDTALSLANRVRDYGRELKLADMECAGLAMGTHVLFMMGSWDEALARSEQAQSTAAQDAPRVGWVDVRGQMLLTQSWVQWGVGLADRARASHRQMQARSQHSFTPLARCFAALYGLVLPTQMADFEQVLDKLPEAEALTTRYAFAEARFWLPFFRGMACLHAGRHQEAIESLESAVRIREADRNKLCLIWALTGLAESRIATGALVDARTAIDRGFELYEELGERWQLSEQHRVDALWHRVSGDESAAAAAFERAMAAPGRAPAWELRAAIDYAELLAEQGEKRRAERLLRSQLAHFSEGADTPDQRRARARLWALNPAARDIDALRRRMTSGRFRRAGRLLGLWLRSGALRVAGAVSDWPRSATSRAQRQAQRRLRHAERVADALGDMRGVFMKLGQIVGFVADGLAPEMRDALQSLQTRAPRMDVGLVHDRIRAEFGRSHLELYAEFDEQPVASASIGQVHRARLHSGEEVAVKVQFPGVAETIEADLAHTPTIARMLRMVMRDLDPGPVIEELRTRIGEELDYRIEARNQQVFFELFDGHPFVQVPRVHTELSGRHVLTTEFIHARPFESTLGVDAATRARNAEMLWRAVFSVIVKFIAFNTDPHPGNFLFTDDGKLVMVDFGSAKFFPGEFMARWITPLYALLEGDVAGHLEGAKATGFVTPDTPLGAQLFHDYMLEFQKPMVAEHYHFLPEHQRAMMRLAARPYGRFAGLERHYNIPGDFLFVFRILFGVFSILTRWDAEGPFGAIYREYMFNEAPVTALGEQDWAFRREWLMRRGLDPQGFFFASHEGIRPRALTPYQQRALERRARQRGAMSSVDA